MSGTVKRIGDIYQKLYQLYGPQGWWPLIDCKGPKPVKTGAVEGYHPLNYDLPVQRNHIYEIIVGTILTQNTAWLQVNTALHNLNDLKALVPEKLLKLDDEILKSAIRPAGFLNQKAIYLKKVTQFFIDLDGETPSRKELLEVKGVGNETADSILLYAYKQPEFVVDTYTRRLFSHLGLSHVEISYLKLKNLFENSLPRDVPAYQEYHALIVEHAKRYYNKKPHGVGDPLSRLSI
ncbi:MAG TPA: endonuclease III domain-containing protein [Methanobacterium sp.]|mgnify:CR=1 FL=1|nr:endonuclease III domain-containing protein [Methanobacterium sp.]